MMKCCVGWCILVVCDTEKHNAMYQNKINKCDFQAFRPLRKAITGPYIHVGWWLTGGCGSGLGSSPRNSLPTGYTDSCIKTPV